MSLHSVLRHVRSIDGAPYSLRTLQVATINYVRQYTDIPVPIVYHFDSNPYNRLGGEYILMSKVRYYTTLSVL